MLENAPSRLERTPEVNEELQAIEQRDGGQHNKHRRGFYHVDF